MKLFRRRNSKFYWYDFTVRGQRYRGSTQETKAARAATLASLKLAQVVDGTDPVPRKAPVLLEFSRRFLDWLEEVRLEDKTKTYYRDGWRLLKTTTIPGTQMDQITSDSAETLKFSGSSSNANCALRTLRRMLHKAEEWKLIRHVPKIKLMKEHENTDGPSGSTRKRRGSYWWELAPASGGSPAGNSSSTSSS